MGSRVVLGVSADYHDAAAAVVADGTVVAAAAEERFTRVKHDASLPRHAIEWCLEFADVRPDDLDQVVFYDKPMTTYERILATHAKVGPRGFGVLAEAVGQWTGSKLWIGYRIERLLDELGFRGLHVRYAEHHHSHAAAAFYPSPFERAAILTIDGVGEWATSTIGWGHAHRIEMLQQLDFPDSLGLFYSAFTAFCGFAVNDGEYKLMGLAPFGQPVYAETLRRDVIDIADDGSVRLDQRWFDYRAGKRMTSPRLAELLDGPPRSADQPLGQREADIARSVQVVLEDAVLAMARHAHELTGERALCLAGGVALNCVANARLRDEGPFEELWVQPAAGDAGSAIGAALWGWHQLDGHLRTVALPDGMSGAFLGPGYEHDEIATWLRSEGIEFEEHLDLDDRCAVVAKELADGAIVGWFQGRMEFGPRALGHRSILADPRDPTMTTRINLAVKRREGFRPFAPAVLAEEATDWFHIDRPSPYMLFTVPVADARRRSSTTGGPSADAEPTDFAARLAETRSDIPACTHVDHSARVQTVDADENPVFHRLIRAFRDATGCPVVLNTSFNLRDEPIVRTPADAVRCFLGTDLDLLVMEGCVIRKQPGVTTASG